MKTIFAEILGRHTAEVIQQAIGLTPGEIRIDRQPRRPPLCELAVRIDFKGRLVDADGDRAEDPAAAGPSGREISGSVLCGFVRPEHSRPLLTAMARHLNLDEGLIDAPEGPVNLLKEFLNIIIGLTGAEWAEQGFEMDFSTPLNLSGQAPAPPARDETAYHVTVGVESGARVDLLAVFRG